jgi:hypothetical protein
MKLTKTQRFFGRLVHKYAHIFEKLGRFETSYFLEELDAITIDRPIYVTSLARSGTTILLELLAEHQETGSMLYKDYPFVYMPMFWDILLRLTQKTDYALKERAHKDRIMVSPNSPEALEEPLWMYFFPDTHNPHINNVLTPKKQNHAFNTFYQSHIQKILKIRNKSRYLAKGNYNILRLEYLQSIYPDAKFIIPIRDPISHIASLVKQHALFCEEEHKNPDILEYMTQIGHFEFGLDCRPNNLNNTEVVKEILAYWRSDFPIEGWALYWHEMYSYILNLLLKNKSLMKHTILIFYDDLCHKSEDTLKRLYQHCELEIESLTLQEQSAKLSFPSYYKHSFSDNELNIINMRTTDIYEKLKLL